MLFHRSLLALLSVLLPTTFSAADEYPLQSDINTSVPGHSGMVYLNLLRQLVPDLEPNETIARGSLTAPVRHVLGSLSGSGRMTNFPDRITIGSFQTGAGFFEGEARMLILASLSSANAHEAPTLLITYSDNDKPKLADVADVALSETVRFGTPQPVTIGPKDQLVVATSQRNDGDVTELTDVMMFMHHGKFESFGIVARTEKVGCGFEWTQPIAIAAQKPSTPGPYDDIKVTITDTGALIENGCSQSWGVPPFAKSYSALFQWDPAHDEFVADMSELDSLKAISDARF